MSGSGWFVNGAERRRFSPGDVMLVPARVPHRFEEFTDDLVVWAMFCSPQKEEVK
jgi:mannose-6-phosphate isomerase-like protein (cupin superfamily)